MYQSPSREKIYKYKRNEAAGYVTNFATKFTQKMQIRQSSKSLQGTVIWLCDPLYQIVPKIELFSCLNHNLLPLMYLSFWL